MSEWSPPSDAVLASEDTTSTWSPPSDAVLANELESEVIQDTEPISIDNRLNLKPDEEGLYNIRINDKVERFATPFMAGEPSIVRTQVQEVGGKANKNQVESMVNVMDSLQKDVYSNLSKYGVVKEGTLGAETYNLTVEDNRKIKDTIYEDFKSKTGLDVDRGSFDYIYNALEQSNKDKVEQEYKLSRIRPESTTLNKDFENEFAAQADKGKSETQLKVESLKEKQGDITFEITSIDNKINQVNNNQEITSDQKEAQLDDLEDNKKRLLQESKNLDSEINVLATTTERGPGRFGEDFGVSYQKTNKELTADFFNEQGRSEETVKRLSKLAEDTDNTAGVKAQNILNTNPGISQREAIKKLYEDELLYLQQFQADGSNKFINLKFSQAQLTGGNPIGSGVLKKLRDNNISIDENGNAEVSLNKLRNLGIDSRDFEGFFDSLPNMVNDKDLKAIKSYNEEIDEVSTIAKSYRNLWRNNVDVGAIEKPSSLGFFTESAAKATLSYVGFNEKEADDFITGGKGTARTRINNLDTAIKVANQTEEVRKSMGGKIDLTDKQKENIDVSLSEEVATGVGTFVPDLMILGATGGVMNGLGYAKLISKMSPMAKFVTGALVEEAKMQLILDMKPGGGATFYTLGQATAGLTPFKKRLTWLDPIFQKVIKAGPVGAISAEGAQVSELAYESLIGDKNFNTEFEELYKDFDTVARRAIVNSMVFGATGFTHVKRGDFMSTRRKYEVVADLQAKVNELMGLPKETATSIESSAGVTIPDALKPKKNFEDLTPKEQKKFMEYSKRIQTLNQQIQVETMYHKLDPNSKNFEKDFDQMVTQPMNKGIKAVIPEFEGVKVKFGRGKEFRKQNFETNDKGQDLGNTAEYNPKTKEMFFDLDSYTAGKSVHEFTHAAVNAYFDANPNAKRNFTKRMSSIFSDFDFGQYTGTELETKIKNRYGLDLSKVKDRNLTAEEYLAFMGEFLADPKFYYTDTNLASNLMNEFRLEIKDILIESGIEKFAPTPKTAKDMVQLMALLGKSTRMGSKLDVKIGTLAKLDEIDILGTRLIEGNKEAVTKETRASKEIIDENENIVNRLKEAKEKGDTQAETDAKNDLLINNQGLINEFVNTKFVPDLGITREDFRSGVQLHVLDKVNKTYDPLKNPEYGAYLRQVLFGGGGFGGGRLGNILKELGQQGDLFTKDISDPTIAKQIETKVATKDTPVETQKRKAIVVSDRLGSLADKVVSKVKDKVSTKDFGEEFLEKQTYKSLKDLASEETQLMFGIKPKPGNLTKSDVKNAQIFINKDPDLFISLLPKQHTTKIVKTSKRDSQGNFIEETRPDKATGIQNVLLEAFYNKGTRKDNLTPWTKKSNIKVSDFLDIMGITERGKPNLYRKDSNVSARIKALVEQTGRIITNQTVREVFPDLPSTVAEGKSPILASKILTEVKDVLKIKNYTEEKLKKDLKLLASDNINDRSKITPGVSEFLENFLLDASRKTLIEAAKDNPTFKSEIKKLKPIKFGSEEVLPSEIVTPQLGTGTWGQVRRLGKKIYEEYDLDRVKEQIEMSLEFAKVFPKDFLKGSNLLQTFWMGTRTTADRVKTIAEGTSETPKYIKGTKIEIGSVDAVKDQYKRLLEAQGSGKESKFFKDLIADFKKEGVQKSALKKAMEKASTDSERIEILQKAINEGDNKLKADLYYAIESAKQEWLYSSKDKNEFIRRARYIYQGASSNTNLILGSARQFVPIEAVYFKPGEKFSFEKLKLEHLKSSLQQSMDAATAVVEGRFIDEGRKIMSDYRGIISEKKYLDIIDKIGGTTNTSGLARMSADLNNLKNYRTVQSGFKETLYDKVIRETAKELNSKEADLKENYIIDEVARYIADPIPSNEIIIKNSINNKKQYKKVFNDNIKSFNEYDVLASKDLTFAENLENAKNRDKAIELANKKNKPVKKIRVFDFDDTLAFTKSDVLYTAPDGTKGKLNAEEFAKQGKNLLDQGYKFDFSEFNKVSQGKRGPLFKVAEKIRNARGNEDLFVLTARAPEARDAIYEFLKSEGLEFKKENIIGLGNSTGEAKANWLTSKAAEGYNDFYFADDAVANVKAVKDAMSVLDVKSKVQQVLASKDLSTDFNKLLEKSTGVEYFKEYSAAKAKTVGASKGKFKFFIPYSAEDFTGLVYPTLSKGRVGDAQMAWYKENLFNPYSRAMDNLSRDRVQLMADFKELKKQLDVPKDLRKTNESGFTNEQAVRVYLFEKTGSDMTKSGLSKTDKAELLDIVNNDSKLKAFADQILTVTKGDGYAKPGDSWLAGTITTDLIDLLNTTKRGKYLEEWKQNVDQIYSKENLNKLEAIYGTKYREALENSLARMKSGKNRLLGGNRLSNQMLDYINGSNAAIMFFNMRSAVLQTISSINYVNWSFNNPLRAGKALANQPQFWKDVKTLLNSNYLMDRRNGLKLNINESEIADAAATSKNKFKAGIQYILQKGYLPTQFADSFAIASGGATFYRNRINDLTKKGVELKEAETQALLEWRQISEESQQSANPSKISQQQASDAGRLILMFANTPMQYARIQKRAVQDLINGRGDAKTNISKIAYYGFVQNLLFNGLQNALFKMGFDDTDEVDEKGIYRTANGMLDGILRGTGIGGAAVSVGKNFLMDVYERSNRDRPEYVDAAWKLTQFSPPLGSKISKIKQAAYAFDNKKMRKEIYSKGFSLDNPAMMSGAKTISATTNVPLDRLLQKYNNIDAALAEDTELWERIAMLGGWPEWQIKQEIQKEVLSNKDIKYKEPVKFKKGKFKKAVKFKKK
jgi:hypothetical protein